MQTVVTNVFERPEDVLGLLVQWGDLLVLRLFRQH